MRLFLTKYVDIEINANAFRVLRQSQVTTQKNYIKLRFKTMEATGLIMLAQGADKEHFLSMELFRGKLR